MSVESARNLLMSTTSFTSFQVRGLDMSRMDAWVSLVHSGELTYRITEKTPHLDRIEFLCMQVINTSYNMVLWSFHAGDQALDMIREMLDENMDRTDEIKTLIEATPLDDEDDGYGYGASNGYGIQAVEEGYGDVSIADDQEASEADE